MTSDVAQAQRADEYHIEETHHTSKVDAPSGTALTMKQIVLAEQPERRLRSLLSARAMRVGCMC